jgi:cation-dependent mannose-6-phosphate receptor
VIKPLREMGSQNLFQLIMIVDSFLNGELLLHVQQKKKGAKGGWGVFFTIFIIALIVYFVGGIVYNRMVHNASGVYQIPNWEFWSNSCDFLKDMILIILAQCPVFKPRRSGRRSYSNLPRDEENILIEEEFEEH